MKYLLNVISIALVLIWLMVYWSTNPFQTIDLLIVLAGLILLIRVLFNKKLSNKKEEITNAKIVIPTGSKLINIVGEVAEVVPQDKKEEKA